MSKWTQRCIWNPYMRADTCCSNTFISAAAVYRTLPKSKVWEPIIGLIPLKAMRYSDECLHKWMYTSVHGARLWLSSYICIIYGGITRLGINTLPARCRQGCSGMSCLCTADQDPHPHRTPGGKPQCLLDYSLTLQLSQPTCSCQTFHLHANCCSSIPHKPSPLCLCMYNLDKIPVGGPESHCYATMVLVSHACWLDYTPQWSEEDAKEFEAVIQNRYGI